MADNRNGYYFIHIVTAPLERVLPLCVGISRATETGAVLTHNVTEAPFLYHEPMKSRSDYEGLSPGYLVSTPKGRPDLTLIECPPYVVKLVPKMEWWDTSLKTLSIWSHVESREVGVPEPDEAAHERQRKRWADVETLQSISSKGSASWHRLCKKRIFARSRL